MPKHWYPCILTLLNLACGITALLFGINGKLDMALSMSFFALFFDAFDGRVARKLNATSEFGKELDSLADLVSFGVAPAIILYMNIFKDNPNSIFGYIICVGFTLCGAIRLARFNVLNIKDHFVGVPIPAAGLVILLTTMVLKQHMNDITGSLIAILFSFLMVSSIKIPKI